MGTSEPTIKTVYTEPKWILLLAMIERKNVKSQSHKIEYVCVDFVSDAFKVLFIFDDELVTLSALRWDFIAFYIHSIQAIITISVYN